MNNAFLERMQKMLKDEYEDYLKTLDEDFYRGLRINPLKVKIEDFLNLNLYELNPTPFAKESFYIDANLKGIGNSAEHLSGMFYLQEPSASSAVSVLDVQKGDWVLDLCAAPGGKSSQIAAKLMNTGFLLSNEIDSSRAQILLSNMERFGVSENMITNAYPEKLCEQVQGWFDKVLVDAPCSGEGMFKKHSKAINEWSVEHVEACAKRQLNILDSAYLTLKENGILVYSTCTYSQEENEGVIYEFLKKYPDMELIDCGVEFGRSGIAYADLDVSKVRRIFPMDHGEGHFVAKLRRTSENKASKMKTVEPKKIDECVIKFMRDNLESNDLKLYQVDDKVYAMKNSMIQLNKIKILRQGIMCGEVIKNRFEPHQHFYMASLLLNKHQQTYELNEEETVTFLSGNVLPVSGYKGYVALLRHGIPLGFGKGDGMSIKNKFPKGLRVR